MYIDCAICGQPIFYSFLWCKNRHNCLARRDSRENFPISESKGLKQTRSNTVPRLIIANPRPTIEVGTTIFSRPSPLDALFRFKFYWLFSTVLKLFHPCTLFYIIFDIYHIFFSILIIFLS